MIVVNDPQYTDQQIEFKTYDTNTHTNINPNNRKMEFSPAEYHLSQECKSDGTWVWVLTPKDPEMFTYTGSPSGKS